MKRAALYGLTLGLALVAGLAPAKVGGAYHVHEVKTFVMSQPRRFARKLGELRYKDTVQVVAREGEWYRIAFDGQEGWVPLGALTEGGWQARSGRDGAGGTVERDSVQLAARGFTADIEQRYAASHPDLDFALVDGLEGSLPDPTRVLKFAEEGGLKGVAP